MPLTAHEFVRRLAEAAPEVEGMLSEHLADNDREVLLHPFVAAVRDYAIQHFEAGDRDVSARLVRVFEVGLVDGDDSVQNAVSVSFVEDTPWWAAERAEFIAWWPDRLRAEAEWWASQAQARSSEEHVRPSD